MRSLVCFVARVVINGVALSSEVNADAFTRIADTTSTVPGFGADFTALGRRPVLSAGEILFWGQWGPAASASQGLFLYNNGVISDIADTTMQRPDGPGTFSNFNGYDFDGTDAVFADFH